MKVVRVCLFTWGRDRGPAPPARPVSRSRALPSIAASAVALVIEAEQVQDAVHDEMAQMVGERLALLRRLARHRLEGEHDIAEQAAARRPAASRRRSAAGRTARWSARPCRDKSRLSRRCSASSVRMMPTISRHGAGAAARAARAAVAASAAASGQASAMRRTASRRCSTERRRARASRSTATVGGACRQSLTPAPRRRGRRGRAPRRRRRCARPAGGAPRPSR